MFKDCHNLSRVAHWFESKFVRLPCSEHFNNVFRFVWTFFADSNAYTFFKYAEKQTLNWNINWFCFENWENVTSDVSCMWYICECDWAYRALNLSVVALLIAIALLWLSCAWHKWHLCHSGLSWHKPYWWIHGAACSRAWRGEHDFWGYWMDALRRCFWFWSLSSKSEFDDYHYLPVSDLTFQLGVCVWKRFRLAQNQPKWNSPAATASETVNAEAKTIRMPFSCEFIHVFRFSSVQFLFQLIAYGLPK